MGRSVASLIVNIGARDQEVQDALASIGQKARSLDVDLQKIGSKPIGDKATKSLETMRGAMSQIVEQQKRMAERADQAARGLEAIGGSARLTDTQLKQVNKTLQQGLEAYRALGQEAPEHLQKVANSVKGGLNDPMALLQGKAVALGAAIGTALGGAVLQVGQEMVAAGKRSFDYADSLSNLAQTTDITVEGLQRIEALGTTSGVSLEQLAGAVGQLQKKLDDPKGREALAQMGLDYGRIRSLKPEDQFIEIAAAVGQVEDPIARMNAGTALFGKQWETIAPAVRGNVKEIVDGVRVVSKEQIEALDEAGDAWDQWVKDRERDVTRFLGSLVLMQRKAKEIQDAKMFGPPGGGTPDLPASPAGRGFALSTRQAIDPEAIENLELFGKTLKQQNAEAEKAAAAQAELKKISDQLFGRAVIAQAEQYVAALGSEENLTKLTTAATRQLHEVVGQALEAYKAAGREVPAQLQRIYNETIRISNTPITVKAVGGPSLQGLTKTFVAYGEAAADGTIYTRDLSFELQAAQIQTDYLGNVIKTTLIPPIETATADLGDAGDEADEFGDHLDDLSDAFVALAQVADGAFGDIAQAIGKFITAIQLAHESGKALKTGFDEFRGGKTIEGLTDMASAGLSAAGAIDAATSSGSRASRVLGGAAAGAKAGAAFGPWGAAVGAGVGAVVGAVRGRREGRNLVKDFGEQFGGLNQLRERLNALGEEGERLWDRLHSFDAGDAEEAKRAIEEVSSALSEASAQFRDTQAAIDEIGGKFDDLTVVSPELQAALDAAFSENTVEGFSAAIAKVNAQIDDQQAKLKQTEGVLAKYGIAFEDAGDAFQTSKINERAKELKDDFDLLREQNIDINAQMRAMGGSVREFVKDAKKAGVEVPEFMMHIIQTAIDAGEVFDEAGNKITNINQLGLNFGTTFQQSADKMADTFDRLGLVLEGLAKFLGVDLPDAAADAAEGIEDELGDIKPPKINIDIGWNEIDLPSGITSPEELERKVPGFSGGSEGIRNFGAGTLAVLHGREGVFTEDQLRSMLSAAELGAVNLVAGANAGFGGGLSVVNHFSGPLLASREYCEETVAPWILDGIERLYLQRFGRLQAQAGR